MSTVNRDPIEFIRKRGYQLLLAAGLVLVVTVFAFVLAMRPTKTEVAFDYARKVIVMRDDLKSLLDDHLKKLVN